MIKLELGKVYKVEYIDKKGNADKFIGVYQGIMSANTVMFLACEKEDNRRGHLFNSYYNKDGYESFWIGTDCINSYRITESSKEEMLSV